MAHLQYMPGDPRLVDQLVYELKSKGIFDQFRKECIADVDTRPAYQNLRQRVENSVSSFLSRQCWKPDLNKNQLREKLRKHILDGNYLEQGVERIVDQVVNPKVASVFIPQVEDLVYNYLGISRKKSIPTTETSNGKLSTDDLLPTDLEAVSPGSVKSNDEKPDAMEEDITEDNKMDVDENAVKEEVKLEKEAEPQNLEDIKLPPEIREPETTRIIIDSDTSEEKSKLVLNENIKLENIPAPENSPPKFDLEKMEKSSELPRPDEIPLPNLPKEEKSSYFKTMALNSDDESSSDSSLRRNMSPLTPIRNYNNENSCDAQQAFDNDSDSKSNDKKEPNTFRFTIDAKSPVENSPEEKVEEKKDSEQTNLSYQFNNQVNINTFNTPLYDDSSNSNNLQIDYESDANSKTNNAQIEKAAEQNDQNSEDAKKDKKSEEKKSSSSYKSSHKSRDSHRHSSSKDKRSDSKQSSSRDSSRHDKKSKDDHSKSKSSHREREKSKDRSDKKDSRDSSKHRSSTHKSSSSSHKDSKSHRSSSTSQKPSSDKSDRRTSDDKKTSSSHKERSERSSDKSSRDKKDSKSSSHRSDKDKKSSSSSSKSKSDDKDKKKDKKETDDHYSLSGRGNHGRRSTDRDSNDGSSSSKGSQNHTNSKSTGNKKESKESSSKSDNTSTSGESASPCDKEIVITNAKDIKNKPIRVENHLEVPIASPPRLPFVPDVTLKKPKFAANREEAKRMARLRKFLDDEQKKMNQEAALLLEFQANVRPSLSQVYSSISGPELEFACISHTNEIANIDTHSTEPIKMETEAIETNLPVQSDEIPTENAIDTAIAAQVDDTISENTDIEEMKPSVDKNETYNENKPFSQLMEEISEISKASEKKKDDTKLDDSEEDKKEPEYFEVTIITEELSETDEPIVKDQPKSPENNIENSVDKELQTETDEEPAAIETEDKIPEVTDKTPAEIDKIIEDNSFRYFAEHEKYEAELKRHQYSDFLKTFTEKTSTKKVYLLNCDTYEENILREVYSTLGEYKIVNYYKNGHLKLAKPTKNVVKDVNLASEIILPLDSQQNSNVSYQSKSPSPVFSPVKSECSFELSSDYDAKLEEMVNKTSRQEVMEIILGSIVDSDNATIDYCTESSIESDSSLKRKLVDVESTVNNNRHPLAKIRKLSEDQISSTTEETEEISNNNRVNPPRSKYLGRAKRVGLPRPKKTNLPNSPSSDKSVENYEQNTLNPPQTQNGKMKPNPRNKVQRYDTSDLYKPKLHYLSRRNNIS